ARDALAAPGAEPTGARAERILRSPQFRDGAFRNRMPATLLPPGSGPQMLRELLTGPRRRPPPGPLPLVSPTGPAPADGLRIIWSGHSSALVEIAGRRVLFAPV